MTIPPVAENYNRDSSRRSIAMTAIAKADPRPARVDERGADEESGSGQVERRHAENRLRRCTLALERKGAEMDTLDKKQW